MQSLRRASEDASAPTATSTAAPGSALKTSACPGYKPLNLYEILVTLCHGSDLHGTAGLCVAHGGGVLTPSPGRQRLCAQRLWRLDVAAGHQQRGAPCDRRRSHSLHFFLYQFRVFEVPNTVWGWLFTFVVIDFVFYWYHRAQHRVRFMWCAHVVHHSSEHMNLGTALRQSPTGPFTRRCFTGRCHCWVFTRYW